MPLDVGRLLGLDVGGAVLEPEQVARRGLRGRRGRGPAEAELRPAHARGAEGDPGEVADRVHRDLRVVGAGLDAQVAVAARRVEVVAREVRQPDEAAAAAGRRGRTGRRRRRRVREQRPPEPERDRQAGRRQAERLAGVVGRRVVRGRRSAPTGPAASPASAAAASSSSRRSRSTSSSRDVVVTSNAAECSRSCAGVTMPAWCAPGNGYVRLPAAAARAAAGAPGSSCRRRSRRPPRARRARRRRAARRHAEERPARDAGAPGLAAPEARRGRSSGPRDAPLSRRP